MTHPRHDPLRRCMPVAEWPAADRTAWATALAGGDVLDDAGPAVHWRADTRRKVASAYGRWLTFLQTRGWLDPLEPLGQRVSDARLQHYLDELAGTVAPLTATGRILDLAEALRVMDPNSTWRRLREIHARLARTARPTRRKQGRLAMPQAIYDLGLRLMDRAEVETLPRKDSAPALFRDGLLIAFLAARPLRVRTLLGLRLGVHLLRQPEGYACHLAAADTKNRRPEIFPLPASLAPRLDAYIERWRPRLLGDRTSDRLWIANGGRPLSPEQCALRIGQHTARHLGVRLNPHLFRDCAATGIAIDDPAHVHMGKALLGHARLDTMTTHYNQATCLEGARQYQAVIERLRRTMTADHTPPYHRKQPDRR